MRILSSAHKHGVSDSDILHALFTSRLSSPFEGGHMKVGRDARGHFLEIEVILDETGEEVVIHDMKARPKYLP